MNQIITYFHFSDLYDQIHDYYSTQYEIAPYIKESEFSSLIEDYIENHQSLFDYNEEETHQIDHDDYHDYDELPDTKDTDILLIRIHENPEYEYDENDNPIYSEFTSYNNNHYYEYNSSIIDKINALINKDNQALIDENNDETILEILDNM